MIKILAMLIVCSLPSQAEERREAWYITEIAKQLNGQREVTVPRGRVDVVTATHAIEVEFAAKWKNAIGQALWYAHQTNKKAGIVLVMRDELKDAPYAIALGSLIEDQKLPIKVWLWPRDFAQEAARVAVKKVN
jgi:hypothetical protein